MMQQLDAFAPYTDTPRARRSDPETSHIAADSAKDFAGAHQRILKDAVREFPGSTYLELAQLTGLERHAVARRLKELEPHHIRRGESRACKGRPMLTWWPV